MALERDEDIEQFQLIVEQLEVCRDLILGGTVAKARMALILLDNAAEIILFRLSRQTLSRDRYFKWIMPERFSAAERRTVDRIFQAKLGLAHEEHSIEEPVVTILGILHSYRNAAFHRDTHNPSVVGTLARIAFRAVSDLFAHTRGGIRASAAGGYKTELHWLSRYGLAKRFIDYEEAARVISERLAVDAEPSLEIVREQLASDIRSRIASIHHLVENELPWKTANELNRVLKLFEFKDADPELEDRLSESYRGIVYKIASRQPVDVTPVELDGMEEKFRADYEARLEAYQQQLKYEDLGRLEARAEKLVEAPTLSHLLADYSETDSTLSTLERYLALAFGGWDRAVQLEIDRRRGK